MTRLRTATSALLGGIFPMLGAAAALSQTYVDNVVALHTTNTVGVVTLGGYYDRGDGGGGVLYPLGYTTCTDNGGTTFKDHLHNCLARVNPTNNVRRAWNSG